MKEIHFRSLLHNLIIYLLITIIPSLIISYGLAHQKANELENQYKSQAQWYASFHARNIENFIAETIARLEMLATLIDVDSLDMVHIHEILKKTCERDTRFSGFYWTNPSGDILISTNELSSAVNISDRPYFKQALKSKKSMISDAHIGRVTGRYIVTIATPVHNDGKVQGMLLASLRLDHLESELNRLVKDEHILITDSKKQTLIQTASLDSEENIIEYSLNLELVPWTMTAKIMPDGDHLLRHAFLQYFIVVLIITSVLFLLLQYYRLKLRLKKEKEQNEIQKLELVGNLAASTVHEIRNPLTGIKGLVKLLSEEYKDEKAQFYFEVIQGEINRINAIASELLFLGKPTAYTLNIYDANDIVREIEPIIQSEANYKNVHFTIELSNMELPIACVKDHIKQVILNLSKNSLHSMSTDGHLTISLDRENNNCVIKVKDTGGGIPKEVLNQVFNPFFTMKKDGSGLGLTVCKRIIDSYGGKIHISSTVDVGTQVVIELPLEFRVTK